MPWATIVTSRTWNELRVDPERISPCHLFLNRQSADVTAVLLVGDAQPFDLEVPVVYNTVFDESIFEQLARGRTPSQVREALAAQNVWARSCRLE